MGALMSGANNISNEQKEETTFGNIINGARALAQGITFGTADELEAFR